MSVPVTESPTDSYEMPVLRWSGQRRFKYFVTGVIGPIACFALVGSGFNARINSLWQSGSLDAYLTLMLEFEALLPFMPLLVFSMITLSACCFNPQLAKKLWVRVGVYGGGILSTQYLFFVVFVGSFFPFLCAAVVGPLLALLTWVAFELMPRKRRITIFQIMLLTTTVAVGASACVWLAPTVNNDVMNEVAELLAVCFFWTIFAIPLLNCITYVRAAFAMIRSPSIETISSKDQRTLFAIASAWLLGFGASWKLALDAMLAEYAKLPTSPPKCYVSSAAACGHRRFVGVVQFAKISHTDCQNSFCPVSFPLNLQMCRLKFLELAVSALSPTAHRRLRRVYDLVGPGAAALCRSNVWFADATYVALKPLELLASLVQAYLGVSSPQVSGLYSQGSRMGPFVPSE